MYEHPRPRHLCTFFILSIASQQRDWSEVMTLISPWWLIQNSVLAMSLRSQCAQILLQLYHSCDRFVSPTDEMEGTPMITASSIRQIMTYPLLIDRLRVSYFEIANFTILHTIRHAIAASGLTDHGKSASPTLLLMPAWCTIPERPYLLVKSVTVFPENG